MKGQQGRDPDRYRPHPDRIWQVLLLELQTAGSDLQVGSLRELLAERRSKPKQ